MHVPLVLVNCELLVFDFFFNDFGEAQKLGMWHFP